MAKWWQGFKGGLRRRFARLWSCWSARERSWAQNQAGEIVFCRKSVTSTKCGRRKRIEKRARTGFVICRSLRPRSRMGEQRVRLQGWRHFWRRLVWKMNEKKRKTKDRARR